jgi:hypothetical protein
MAFGDGIRRLGEQLGQVSATFERLEDEVLQLDFDHSDPASVREAIHKGERRVDEAARLTGTTRCFRWPSQSSNSALVSWCDGGLLSCAVGEATRYSAL